MPLYDLERGGGIIIPEDFFTKYVEQFANQLASKTFKKICDTFDQELDSLKPAKKSQLTWTRCGAMIGFKGSASGERINHMWEFASRAAKQHPDTTNKFVGSILMWRISLRPEKWLTQKTQGKNDIHPHRGYWIYAAFKPTVSGFSVQDLEDKFNKK